MVPDGGSRIEEPVPQLDWGICPHVEPQWQACSLNSLNETASCLTGSHAQFHRFRKEYPVCKPICECDINEFCCELSHGRLDVQCIGIKANSGQIPDKSQSFTAQHGTTRRHLGVCLNNRGLDCHVNSWSMDLFPHPLILSSSWIWNFLFQDPTWVISKFEQNWIW